ncbi:PRC-barrel domain containing protein [Streptomyces sp. TRM66268-LWL]|uniref:PRC-barrel domain containing protein n=1 Tax=Streptomyces polyasparticus TaxID=2767826 RepID=A0ABR7SGS9_9ACTN|nr:PRC-barrel domain containing protein [Streptomyces polyasparticus]MBC9714696.1 PRC-barrel domain containing protein [Streptomyces polyasparticus]
MTDSPPLPPLGNAPFTPVEVIGYSVEGDDGPAGEVDAHSEEVGPDHLVVNTGGTLFNKRVLLPCWAVTHVDRTGGVLHVPHTRDLIRDAPPFDRDMRVTDPGYRSRIDAHYGNGPA